MGLFERFPYTNFHDLNLTWILSELKTLEHTINEFVSINALKYADPIQWNIVTQYEKNTIVIDPLTGTAYISVQPVPSGVSLTNTDYWTVVFDLGSFVTRSAKNFTDRWESEWTQTATFPSNTGDWLVWNDTLYKVISNIIAGDQYVVDSNITHFTMEDLIGHFTDLAPSLTARTSVVTLLNELQSHIDAITNRVGSLDALVPSITNRDDVIDAINDVQSHVDTVTNRVGSLDALVPSITNRDDVIDAINNVQSHVDAVTNRVGSLDALVPSITNRDDVIDAINDVQSHVDFITNSYMNFFDDKNILILGDSISDQNIGIPGMLPNWVDDFIEKLDDIANVTNNSVSGRKMTELLTVLQGIGSATIKTYDIIVIMLGINDYANNIPLGDWSTPGTFNNAIRESHEFIMNSFAGSDKLPLVYFVTPIFCRNVGLNTFGAPPFFYRAAIGAFCKRWNCYMINGDLIPEANELINNYGNFFVDNSHPTTEYAAYIANYILYKLTIFGDFLGSWVGRLEANLSAYSTANWTLTYANAYIDAENTLHLKGAGVINNPGGLTVVLDNIPFIQTTMVENCVATTNIYTDAGIYPGIAFIENGSVRINITAFATPVGSPTFANVYFDIPLVPNWLRQSNRIE